MGPSLRTPAPDPVRVLVARVGLVFHVCAGSSNEPERDGSSDYPAEELSPVQATSLVVGHASSFLSARIIGIGPDIIGDT